MIVAGLLTLIDIAFATIVSVKLLGLTAIAAGTFEIAHAFWTKGLAWSLYAVESVRRTG